MKKIPLGITDFDRLIRENCYYIDKSRFIQMVEDRCSFILLLRPRRMGKSLFSNMMMSYYDIAKKDQFAQLFGSLWIGEHPTPWANKFMILSFNFSKVGDSVENLRENFTKYCIGEVERYFIKYLSYYSQSEIKYVLSQNVIEHVLNALDGLNKIKGYQTYLFIDEYDNFTNTVLAARGVKAHEAITHDDGFYRSFFKSCKDAFERIFMTGVTPVTYDDLTSGFAIAEPISLEPKYDQIVGITETELHDMVTYYQSVNAIQKSTDEIISEIKPYYDGFCFSENSIGIDPPIYNTNSVLRYLNHLIILGESPKEMIDVSSRTETSKLNYLVMAEDLTNREERIETVREICTKGFTSGIVREQFPAKEVGDQRNFKSMLFYFGTLTFAGKDEFGEPILKVPNKTMGELYLQYMLNVAEGEGFPLKKIWPQLNKAIKLAAVKGEWKSLIEVIAKIIKDYSSYRNGVDAEADIQGFLRGLLCLNRYFDIWPELELGKGNCDLLLVPLNVANCPTQNSYIIELKFMKAGEKDLQWYKDKATAQLKKYVSDIHLFTSNLLRSSRCHMLYLIFKNHELADFGEVNL